MQRGSGRAKETCRRRVRFDLPLMLHQLTISEKAKQPLPPPPPWRDARVLQGYPSIKCASVTGDLDPPGPDQLADLDLQPNFHFFSIVCIIFGNLVLFTQLC